MRVKETQILSVINIIFETLIIITMKIENCIIIKILIAAIPIIIVILIIIYTDFF